ncbi:MAG: hypothetical protein D6704_10270 [Nitrospirae bacterium]|nr:MAG: hypothetical protein D6704_10270 [Nitrospirota bacterium]
MSQCELFASLNISKPDAISRIPECHSPVSRKVAKLPTNRLVYDAEMEQAGFESLERMSIFLAASHLQMVALNPYCQANGHVSRWPCFLLERKTILPANLHETPV